MEKNYDIYITFSETQARADNELIENIQHAIHNLRLAVKRIIKREPVFAVKGEDFNVGNAQKIMAGSTLALVFIHQSYEEDNEYQEELSALCRHYGLTKGQGMEKVFKVYLEPIKNEINPYCLEELLSYDFFEKSRFNRRVRGLSFTSDEVSTTLYSKLLDLAFDMGQALIGAGSPGHYSDDEYIYLGLTTYDQQEARDEIRRELLHYGYRVLPSTKMPQTGEEFEKSLNEHLGRSSIAIQLMGAQYGDNLKGTKFSMMDYQNKLIREFQEKQPENLKRFIWIPQNNKISDQRQALYLKRIRRDDATTNTEIIECPLETFKTVLAARLENPKLPTNGNFENISRIFLLTEEEQSAYAEVLYSALSSAGLKINTLDYEEQTGIYARYLQSLRDADAVIILQQSENQYWLNSKLRDLIKSPGIGRDHPYKRVIVITGLLPDAQLIRMIKSKVEVLDDPNPNPDSIIQKLIAE